MTDKECIALLKEKMEGENMPGSIIGGTGIKYCTSSDESGKFQFGLYLPEIKTLFFPIKNESGLWVDYEVVKDVENIKMAESLTGIHYNK